MKALLIAAIAVTMPARMIAQKVDKANPTYDAVIKGLACRQQQSGQMDCEYHVGNSLNFVISGVGQADAAITFFKVNFDDDYYAATSALHGCVVVKPVKRDGADTVSQFAFISPRDGKAYRDWQNCHKATKPAQ